MERIIVIGGGPNGLTAAARLAQSGRKVLLVEARSGLGGLAAGEEFHPLFHHTGLHEGGGDPAEEVVSGLSLDRHGLERQEKPTPLLVPNGEGEALEIGPGLTRPEAYGEWRAKAERFASVLSPLLRHAPPASLRPTLATLREVGPRALALRRLGRREMLEFLRVAPTCAADWLKEYFEDGPLAAALALPALAGSWLGPWSAGGSLNLLARMALEGRAVRGGGAALVRALEGAARAAGVEIRTGLRVCRIHLEGGVVSSVELADGERVLADCVLATCDPRQTLLDLLHPRDLPEHQARRIQGFRARGTAAYLHLALEGPLEFSGAEGRSWRRACLAADLDSVERAFDGIKYGELPERPVLELSCGGEAPQGAAVITLRASFVPHDLAGGWTEEARELLTERILEVLAQAAPGVRELICGQELLTPPDIERRYGTSGGHIHHGEHALDQFILRPTPETAGYRTPLRGLYLGGSGSHPGGGLSCLPGWLAAGAVLAD